MISNRRVLVVILGFAIIGGGALSLHSSRARAASTYALVCNNLQASTLFNRGMFYDYDNGVMRLTMDFEAAAQGDNAVPVPPKTCAWRDRALRSTEPKCIEILNAKSLHYEFNRFASPPWRVVGCDGSSSTSPECGAYRAFTGRQVFLIGSGGDGVCMNVVGTSTN